MINFCTNLCSAFRKIGGEKRAFFESSSPLPSAQHYSCVKGEDSWGGIFCYSSEDFAMRIVHFSEQTSVFSPHNLVNIIIFKHHKGIDA